MSTIPGDVHLDIYPYCDFVETIEFLDQYDDPLDLTGYEWEASLRRTYLSDDVLLDFTCSGIAPTSSGIVSISLTKEQTATLAENEDLDLSSTTTAVNAVYDLVATDPDGLRCVWLRGDASIMGVATHD